jgi:hypothetical protein
MQWVPEILSPGIKRPEREAEHLPPSSAEVMNEDLPPLSNTSSCHGCPIETQRQLYTFTLVIVHYKFRAELQFRIICFKHWSRDSSVGIATAYGRDGRGVGVLVPVGARDFSPLNVVQTCSGAHRTSYPMGTGGSFLGVKP